MYCNQAYTHTTTKILFCVCTGECVYLCVYSLDRAFLPGCLHPSAASVYKQMSQDKGQGCSAPVCIQANSKGTIFLTLVYVEFAVLDRNPWGNVCLSSNSNNAKNDTTIISCYMCTNEQQNRFGTLALFCIFLCPSALQVICMSIHLSLPHKDILTVGNSWLHKDFLYHFRISDHEFCFHKPIKIFCKCIEKTFKHWKNFT